MKSWLIIFVLLAFCVPTWGQSAANHFHFVSSIYAPYGSFAEIVTQPHSGTTSINGTFNIGSQESAGGTININGDILEIHTLKMEHNTSISSNTHWFMKTLTLGKNANVNVRTLIANEVTLANANGPTKETALTVEDTLLIENDTYTKNGRAAHELEASRNLEKQFHFIQEGGTLDDTIFGAEATWKKLDVNANEDEATILPDFFYPIRADAN